MSIAFLSSKAQNSNIDSEKLLAFYQNQKFEEAANYLNSLYPSGTEDLRMLNQIAYFNMMAGKLVDAEKVYLKMDQLQPKTLAVLFNLANISSRRGNNSKAIFYLQNILSVDSSNFNTYKRLADLVDSAELRLSYLVKANQLNATDADIAFDLAKVYRSRKLYLPAYRTLQTAIKADTGNFILQRALLPVANDLNKYNEVIAVGKSLMKQSNADADAVKDIAKANFFLKNYDKCIDLFKLLEKWGMQNETTLYYTTLCYRELKNYKLAASYALKLIDEAISPNTTTYYSLLAGIYESNNQLTNSIVTYKRGLTFKTVGTVYYRLALLYDFKLKQPQTALKYYKLYIKSKDLTKDDAEQINYSKERIADITNPTLQKKV